MTSEKYIEKVSSLYRLLRARNRRDVARGEVFWYAQGIRDAMIANPAVTADELQTIVDVDVFELLDEVEKEVAADA